MNTMAASVRIDCSHALISPTQLKLSTPFRSTSILFERVQKTVVVKLPALALGGLDRGRKLGFPDLGNMQLPRVE